MRILPALLALAMSASHAMDWTLEADLLVAHTDQQWRADSPLNPSNHFNLATQSLAWQWRPTLKGSQGDWQWRLNPTLSGERQTKQGGHDETLTARMAEWAVNWRPVADWRLSLGKQVLQWGPGLTASPSNPFDYDNSRRNPLDQLTGKGFARCLINLDDHWSLNLMARLKTAHDEASFAAQQAIKLDWIGNTASASLVAAHRQGEAAHVGAYGQLTASDAALLFFEASYATGPARQVVTAANNPLGATWRTTHHASQRAVQLIAGGSYTTEGGRTASIEYRHNGHGMAHPDPAKHMLLERAWELAQQATPISGLGTQVLGEALTHHRSGQGRHYLTLQWLDNQSHDKVELFMRYTRNLNDGSGEWIPSLTIELADHLQWFNYGTIRHGHRHSDFGQLLGWSLTTGLQYRFR
ncbi:hypothetical protein HNQ59_000665 [Chitinivorax tropicus]|uniref:Uncharacterized protein n=1 Tax=Chitinivorax tropicus TaxID=714531 RepID=A0A840MQ76_9PROT|nr:hypothetical protein [Chitinivorax tropicus]MBB5017401.1 hypothetical protein [Chitinivorax tropicus]